MLFYIKTLNLFFSRYTKSHSMLDYLENNGHSYCNPCDCDQHACKLYAKAVETAANQKTFPFCTGSV